MPRVCDRAEGRKPRPKDGKDIRFEISCPPKLKEKLDSYLQPQTVAHSTYISKLIEQDLA